MFSESNNIINNTCLIVEMSIHHIASALTNSIVCVGDMDVGV